MTSNKTWGQQPLRTRRDYGTEDETKMAIKLLTATEYDNELKSAKHEKGKSVPLSKLPEEVQENVKNPPESVQKVKEEMEKKAIATLTAADYEALLSKESRFEAGKPADPTKHMSEEDAAEWKKQNEEHRDNFKTARSGLYGSTKDTESCCTSAVKKLQATAKKLAKEIYSKDGDSPSFLSEHGKRTGSKTAKLLVSAMKDLGPKVAGARTAAGKKGLYGYKERTAKIALHACTALHHQAGVIASEMNDRKADAHDRITGFLKEHSKTAKCAYSAMLLESYPPSPVVATALPGSSPKKASDGVSAWYEEQFIMRNAADGTTAEILAWEHSIEKVATDFLASDDEDAKEEPKEDEADKVEKTASDTARRARYFTEQLKLLVSGDFTGSRLGPLDVINQMVIVLKGVGR